MRFLLKAADMFTRRKKEGLLHALAAAFPCGVQNRL